LPPAPRSARPARQVDAKEAVSPPMELFDTHCHLNDPAFRTDLGEVLARARRAGLRGAVCVGIDLASSRAALSLARREPDLWAAVGVHPHHAAEVGPDVVKELRRLAAHPEVVAIGETGLDFYRDLSPRPVQREVFRRQIELAKELGLPLIVHDRDAHRDILDILAKAPDPAASAGGGRAGVMHCFSGDDEMARSCVELGFYVSFAGPITFPKGDRARSVAAIVPPDRLLIETDCPYLAPQSRRGRRNEPAFLTETAAALAEVLGRTTEAAAALTTRNARRLFLPFRAGGGGRGEGWEAP